MTEFRYLEGNHRTHPSKDLFYWNTHANHSASKQPPCSTWDFHCRVQLHVTSTS